MNILQYFFKNINRCIDQDPLGKIKCLKKHFTINPFDSKYSHIKITTYKTEINDYIVLLIALHNFNKDDDLIENDLFIEESLSVVYIDEWFTRHGKIISNPKNVLDELLFYYSEIVIWTETVRLQPNNRQGYLNLKKIEPYIINIESIIDTVLNHLKN